MQQNKTLFMFACCLIKQCTCSALGAGPLPPAVPPLLNIESIQHLQPCRQGCVVPYSPLTGPDAWYGREQQQQTEQWIHTLTTAQIAELEAAVALVQQQLQLRTKGNYLTGVSAMRHFTCLGPCQCNVAWSFDVASPAQLNQCPGKNGRCATN